MTDDENKKTKNSAADRDDWLGASDKEGNGGMEASEVTTYRHDYKRLTPRLTVTAQVTGLTPTGERTDSAEGIWDTGATNTVISKELADRLGIDPIPPMDGEGNPITAHDVRYLGTATIRMRIGEIETPLFRVKVEDFDPNDEVEDKQELPEFLIGMDWIASGKLTVDSSSGKTVVTFEI